jgi:hypothetical protein
MGRNGYSLWLRYYLRIFLEGLRKISKVKICDDKTNSVKMKHWGLGSAPESSNVTTLEQKI